MGFHFLALVQPPSYFYIFLTSGDRLVSEWPNGMDAIYIALFLPSWGPKALYCRPQTSLGGLDQAFPSITI